MMMMPRHDTELLVSFTYVLIKIQVAAQELGIVCFRKRNFMTSSIPLHRRAVHMKKSLRFHRWVLFKRRTDLVIDCCQKGIKLVSLGRPRQLP